MNEKKTMMDVLGELLPDIAKGIMEDDPEKRKDIPSMFVNMVGKMTEAFFLNEVGAQRSKLELMAINATAQLISKTINEMQNEEDQIAAKSAAFLAHKGLHVVAVTELEK